MRTEHVPRDNMDEAELLKQLDRSPKCGFTTPWLLCNGRLLRINFTVVSPQTQKAKHYLSLRAAEPENRLKAITDIVMFLKEKLK